MEQSFSYSAIYSSGNEFVAELCPVFLKWRKYKRFHKEISSGLLVPVLLNSSSVCNYIEVDISPRGHEALQSLRGKSFMKPLEP